MRNYFLFISSVFFLSLTTNAQTTYDIRPNQIGYLPNAIKYAAVIDADAESFEIKTSDLSTTVFTGQLGKEAYYPSSEENVKIADFTVFDTPGEYVLLVEGLGNSVPFSIGMDIFFPLTKSTVKAFYYNRASTALTSEYAGQFARPMGHPDNTVVVLPSAASASRPAGTVISTPHGWYDAGDYNKYIVNSGISTFTLLSAYETYPEFYDTLTWNIPESSNDIPDILDEALWNLKWIMTMQDSTDGGVYNKTTTASFAGFVMPDDATATRYVCAKGTAATLDFAALMAMMARIYKPYLPDLADEALEQSEKAWQWAKANANIPFNNPGAENGYPSVGTGGYGDGSFGDEFAWAAAELYITTGDDSYYSEINLDNDNYDIPGWGNVRTLGLLSIIVNRDSLTAVADTALAKEKLLELIESSKNNTNTTPYRLPGDHFGWGSNSSYANKGMLLIQAFNITHDAGYFNAAVSSMDYLLGKNATSYCFVTGFGTRNPKNIHHRQSGADGIAEPIPGFLVGGPNPGNVNDDCGASGYPSVLPAKAFADKQCSYSTNEVAINWNAPMAFLSGANQSSYLNHFVDSMPAYFIKSASSITLPYGAAYEYELTLSTNMDWSLATDVDWLDFSTDSGGGSAFLNIFSTSDNPTESTRTALIYISGDEGIFDSIAVTQNGKRKEFTVQAENYSGMLGLQTENTTDLGGGMNIGYVDPDDWADYDMDISYEGVYSVMFRHAGYACGFDIIVDGEIAKSVSVPATSGWQDWETAAIELSLTEGVHTLRLKFNDPGLNLNWMQFEWLRELDAIVINSVTYKRDIAAYPVPADNSITVELTAMERAIHYKILSLDGKVVLDNNIVNRNLFVVDISGLQKGVYFLQVNGRYNQHRTTIIKK